jgi:hypothetical protein
MERECRPSELVKGATVGGILGAMLMGAVGSIIPIVGTAWGIAVGALIGGAGGVEMARMVEEAREIIEARRREEVQRAEETQRKMGAQKRVEEVQMDVRVQNREEEVQVAGKTQKTIVPRARTQGVLKAVPATPNSAALTEGELKEIQRTQFIQSIKLDLITNKEARNELTGLAEGIRNTRNILVHPRILQTPEERNELLGELKTGIKLFKSKIRETIANGEEIHIDIERDYIADVLTGYRARHARLVEKLKAREKKLSWLGKKKKYIEAVSDALAVFGNYQKYKETPQRLRHIPRPFLLRGEEDRGEKKLMKIKLYSNAASGRRKKINKIYHSEASVYL